MSDPAVRIVYVIEQDGYVKIGSTTNLKSRLGSLQTGCAVPLRLVGTCTGGFARERALQQEFGAWRRHGEWFKFPPDVMATLMARLTIASRPVIAAPIPKSQWMKARNQAWDERRRKMKKLTDDEAAAKERDARYRRLRSRQGR